MDKSLNHIRREGRQRREGGTRHSGQEGKGTKEVSNQNGWIIQKRASVGRAVQVGTAGCWEDLVARFTLICHLSHLPQGLKLRGPVPI